MTRPDASNKQFFEQVFIDEGKAAWPGEIDLAPDAIYAQIAGPYDGQPTDRS